MQHGGDHQPDAGLEVGRLAGVEHRLQDRGVVGVQRPAIGAAGERRDELRAARVDVGGGQRARHHGRPVIVDGVRGELFSRQHQLLGQHRRHGERGAVVVEAQAALLGRKVARRGQRRLQQVTNGVVVLQAVDAPDERRPGIEAATQRVGRRDDDRGLAVIADVAVTGSERQRQHRERACRPSLP